MRCDRWDSECLISEGYREDGDRAARPPLVPPRWPDVRPLGQARRSGPPPSAPALGRTSRDGRGGEIPIMRGLVQARVQANVAYVESGQIHGAFDRQPGRSQAECREFDPPRPLCLPPMSHDDTGGFSLTNPADSASSGEASGSGGTGADDRTMTGNDPGGRSLVQARVQVVVQGVAGMRLPIRRGGFRAQSRHEYPWVILKRPDPSRPPMPPRRFVAFCGGWCCRLPLWSVAQCSRSCLRRSRPCPNPASGCLWASRSSALRPSSRRSSGSDTDRVASSEPCLRHRAARAFTACTTCEASATQAPAPSAAMPLVSLPTLADGNG